MLLKECDGNIQPSNIVMSYASFWVHLYDLPLKGVNGVKIKCIGESIGVVEDIDLFDYSPGWSAFSKV